MWIVCITSVSHVLKVNGYGGRQAKGNEKRQCFKGWETLVIYNKLVLCIFVVTKLQEHEYLHNTKRLRHLSARLSKSALRRL